MMNEATRRTVGYVVLRGNGLVCRARPWPTQPQTAQLVMYQQVRSPSVADLNRWAIELAQMGFHRVRTSALGSVASRRVEAAGFAPIQELAMLQHDRPHAPPRSALATGRLLVDQHERAAEVDIAAFGPEWSLDTEAITDVRAATPRHRARAAGHDGMAAYAITGRDSRQGFLQRLAVEPVHQREGLGLALVQDSLRWLGRWRVDRVLVNTPITNEPALALYERAGFRRMHARLRVYERVIL